jgi:hypothetical protein
MEWAQGIEVMNGNLVARVADAAGEQNLVNLGELSRRGLPDDRSTVRPLERFSLANLRVIDSDEYLQVFGLQRAAGKLSTHSVYELRTERRRWVIPGLALIRGLFRPHKLMLEEAFRPNVVEATSFFDPSKGQVRIVAPWSTRVGGKANDPSILLSWFWRDPAAMTLANSVHRLAMNGVIGIEPSDVLVDLAVNGLQQGTTFYATRCTTTRAYLPLTTAEASPGHAEVLEFFECSSWRTASQRPTEAPEAVPKHRDGTLMTTDAEWAAVQEILKGEGGHTPRVPVRGIFDAALLEQDGDRDAAALQRCGVKARTVNYYRKKWRNQRSLHQALGVLKEMRART